MKKILILSTLTLAIPVVALAQDTKVANPFSVRAGWSYLTNKDARDATSAGGFTLGVGYDFWAGRSGERYSVDVDYSQHSGNGNKLDAWYFQLAVRAPFQAMNTAMNSNQVSFYYGAGLGVFDFRASGGGFSESRTRFGGSLILGAKVSPNAAIELFYRISDKIDGADVNSLGILLNVKF